jgi:hypothetical protein
MKGYRRSNNDLSQAGLDDWENGEELFIQLSSCLVVVD